MHPLSTQLFDWCRALHGRGMSISSLTIAPESGCWMAYAEHSGLGSYSTYPRQVTTREFRVSAMPGVSGTSTIKPLPQELEIGAATLEDIRQCVSEISPALRAHDVHESGSGSFILRTWGLDQSVWGLLPPDVAEKIVEGTHEIRSGKLLPRASSELPAKPPTKEKPVQISGRKMAVLRPCGCITEHYQAPGKGRSDTPAKRKFGKWLSATPCPKHEKE